ncbi:MAG: cytochrome P450 [Parahaliea sp.]
MSRLEEINFLDPALQKCPYAFNRQLREEAPVYLEPNTGYYLVSRYEDIKYVKRNPQLFSNQFNANSGQRLLPKVEEIAARGWERPRTLHRTDPPVHTDHRKVIDRTFSLPRVKKMVPYIEGVVSSLMDQFPASGELDFVKDYCIPLPCIILADQLGVPREDALMFRVWSDALLDPVGLMIDEEREIECAHQTLEFQQYFAQRIEERRVHPRDDILTDLSTRMEDETPLSIAQLLNMLEQIVTGGNESTAGLMGSALLLLIEKPDLVAQLRADPALIPAFVEEALRLECPVQSNSRIVTQETELGGITLPKGAQLILRYGSGNRDERQFSKPEEVDLARDGVEARSHVAFGFGAHNCPGKNLARQETISTFEELLRRYRGFELTCNKDDLKYHPTFFLRGLQSLPVRLIPA